MQKSVFMFHVGRSGSRVVAKLVNQHPEIDWQGESLYRPNVELFKTASGQPDNYSTFSHLEALSDQRSGEWLGVEVKFYHLKQHGIELEDFVEKLIASGSEHFIIHRRKNILRKIVSSMVAKQTKSYHRLSNEKAALTQIEIDPKMVEIDAESRTLVDFLETYSREFEELEKLLAGRSVLSLSYEDHVSEDPRNAYRKICEFIDVEPGEPEVPLGKTNPFPLDQIVTNLDEVRAALAGTPYAWMTEED